MKKLSILLALVLCLGIFTACGEKTEAPAAESGGEATTLEGTAEGFGGDIVVSVTKEGDKITNVEIKSHEETVDEIDEVKTAIETLPAAIVEANGTEGVEAVSGASFTSEGIINAVNNALGQ